MSAIALARRVLAVLGAFVIFVTAQGPALADGTETLGTPSVAVAAGSGTVASGTGLQAGSGTINVTVPGTPKQALLYWEVQLRTASTATEVMTVNGGPVTGTRIGGPTLFFSGRETTVYRADVTSLVSSGDNALSLVPNTTGLSTGARINDGAGLIVIYGNGTSAEIGIRDGADVAFNGAPDPRKTTIPQTFTFAPEAGDRTSTLTLFTASVSDDVDGPPLRPTGITVSSGVVTVVFNNVLDSNDDYEWDTFVAPITIPAGANSLTVQVESVDNLNTGLNPASLVWIGAGLAVPVTPPPTPSGGEGCTPGYWKQSQHFDSWPAGYTTTQSYALTLGVTPSFTKSLLGALQQGGGGEKALGRHATAALLNSANPNVSYLYSTAEVVNLVKGAYVSKDYEGVKNLLETQNEMGCPLN